MAAESDVSFNHEVLSNQPEMNGKEDKIQSIFRAAPVGIGMVVDRVIIEANDKLCQMTGYSKEELIGKNAIILYPSKKEYEFVGKEKYRQIEVEGKGSVETIWKKKSGELIHILLSSSAIDVADLSKGVTFSALDISERKIFEETIRMRDMQIKSIAENISIVLFRYYIKFNGETGFYYISESSEQIFGIKNNIENFFDEFSARVSPEYRENFLESVDNSIKNRTPWEFEGIFNKDSGESVWFRCSANPVCLEDEVVYNGIGIDITDKIKFLTLSQRSSRLESLAILAGGIAHDFNNIHAGIFGYIEMARNYSGADKIVSGYLDSAMKIFDRSKALTGQLLTFAKGGVPVKKNGSIFKTAVEITNFLMSGSDCSYDYNSPEDLWTCDFDNEQINQAFEHIIKNAIQSMPAGGNLSISAENLLIDSSKQSYMKPGKYVKVSIKDSGTGIPGDMLPRIFDPFFTTKDKSIGMGLPACHSIISRHNGYIDVDSIPGKGTALYIYLPATDAKPEINNTKILSGHSGKGNILLMDDEPLIRETVGAMLKIMGYNVYKVADGDEALKTLNQALTKGVNFTAFILDLTINNGMGGKETMSIIRKMGLKTPAFASSGYSDDPVIAMPEEFGFTDSLRKPYRMEDLASLLNYYLTEK